MREADAPEFAGPVLSLGAAVKCVPFVTDFVWEKAINTLQPFPFITIEVGLENNAGIFIRAVDAVDAGLFLNSPPDSTFVVYVPGVFGVWFLFV